MGTVYHAIDNLTQRDVALKRVTVSQQQFQFSSDEQSAANRVDMGQRTVLAREFRTLASLRHPNIISVLDYGFDTDGQPYYVMELLQDAVSIIAAGDHKPLDFKIDLLVQTLQALIYLHRRGIVHRDLKPDNVVVVADVVKLLDFGLAVGRDYRNVDAKDTGTRRSIVGTLAYMAPEVLQGSSHSEQADLYAFGTIAYELLAGRHPFQTEDPTQLITDLITRTPDFQQLDVNPRLVEVIRGLLEKSPANRPDDSLAVLRAFMAAVDREMPPAAPGVRDSFLRAARFVGRQREFQQIIPALERITTHRTDDPDETATERRGSGWLIGGESGVGKSRLLDELRISALVRGAQVVRSQTISEGEHPYHMWRPVLRCLCLQTELADHEASILKELVPDVDALIGREVADAPEVDPLDHRERIMATIEALFARQHHALVVILEDIHWARSDSLAVLKRLSQRITRWPVLLIASYRAAARSALPDELPHMQALQLQPMRDGEIAEFSESMLGAAGKLPAVVDLLRREAEGNSFFMVEVVRILSEEVGDIHQIGMVTLPEHIFAGGLQSVIAHRLDQIAAALRPGLELAAVIGRQINLDLMRIINEREKLLTLDLSEWLTACANVAVLDVQDGVWRFSHDKLREGVLMHIDGERRRAYHRMAAHAIEQLYRDDVEHAAALAYHWRKAEDTHRELHYARLAGEQALRNSANPEAIRYFRRALDLLADMPASPGKLDDELALLVNLSGPLMATQGYAAPEVIEVCGRARELCRQTGDSPQLVRVLSSLVAYYIASADYETTRDLAMQMLALGQRAGAQSVIVAGRTLLGQVTFFTGDFQGAYDELQNAHALVDPQRRRRRAPFTQDTVVSCLIFQAATCWMLGRIDEGERYMLDAVQMARSLEHDFSLAFALNWAGSHCFYRGEYKRVLRYTSEAIDLSRRRGFTMFLAIDIITHNRALIEVNGLDETLYQGMVTALAGYLRTGARFCLPFFHRVIAEVEAQMGLHDAALRRLNEALDWINISGENWSAADVYRLRGEVQGQRGDLAAAESDLQKALNIAQTQRCASLALNAAVALGKLWVQQGRATEASDLVQRHYNALASGHQTPHMRRAQQFLDSLKP